MNAVSFELICWVHSGIHGQDQNVFVLMWDTQIDELCCVNTKTDLNYDEVIIRRELLSVVSSIYDLISFTSHATLFPKLTTPGSLGE